MSKHTALALAWTLLILTLCWLPTRYVEPNFEPGGFSMGQLHVDKFVHTGLFLILGYLLAGVPRLRRRPGLVVLLGGAIGVLSEVGQAVLPTGRSANLVDTLADLIGVVLGLWLYRWRHEPAAGRWPEEEFPVSVRE